MAVQGQSEERTFIHDGIERTYSIYIPKTPNKSRSLPLLIALHGGRGSAKDWPRYTNYGFEHLADREHFILVYPNGVEGQWNDGRGIEHLHAQRENIDDAGFLARLIDELTLSLAVDKGRVYVVGASNGGMMAHKLAAEYADRVTAIASVIASIPANLEGKLKPAEPVSVLMMNGTEDPLVLWEGGPIKFGRNMNGYVISTEQAFDFWVDHNKCAGPSESIDLLDKDPDDETRVTGLRYVNCASGSEVVLYKVIGGGHTWPAHEETRGRLGKLLVDRTIGRRSREIDACEVIWQFFKGHVKR
ncbi:MAG: alpha/beta fold hydrolase [Candidatus Thiodiazotropha sp.]